MTADNIALAAAALAAVLALIWLAQRAVRAAGLAAPRSQAGSGRLAVVQALALDPRRRLHLVRCDGRHLLLLTGGGSDVVVGWIEDARP
jgi:flagellar protein FliO/FliZ